MKKIVIIGAGAAGLMAAGALSNAGYHATILEHSAKPGRKILITGKGRCNVTNNCDNETFLQNIRRNSRFLYSSIANFNTESTMQLFEQLGVPLKTERGQRVFPVSDKAETVLHALQQYAGKCIIQHEKAVQLLISNNHISGVKLANGSVEKADIVIICTGGLSYPKTGSTGDGYLMAQQAGHTIIAPEASLVPLKIKGAECAEMMGLSLRNIQLKLQNSASKIVFKEQGEMLFTHFGISGPLVLSASAHMQGKEMYTVSVDLKPALAEEVLYKRIGRDFEQYSNKDVKNALDHLLPKKMIPVILKRWGVPEEKKVHQVTKEERQALVHLMKSFKMEVTGKEKIDHAVITSGGVSVKEVSPKTMESKIVKGLYFAGEVLDVDGYTGGFNLQIAFSTAVTAANAIIQELECE